MPRKKRGPSVLPFLSEISQKSSEHQHEPINTSLTPCARICSWYYVFDKGPNVSPGILLWRCKLCCCCSIVHSLWSKKCYSYRTGFMHFLLGERTVGSGTPLYPRLSGFKGRGWSITASRTSSYSPLGLESLVILCSALNLGGLTT